jgi:hypothetical protein
MSETVKRVRDAIESSGVSSIAMIDDAFDPPDIQQQHEAELLDFLQAEKSVNVRKACRIADADWSAAEEALMNGEWDADAVSEVVKSLYSKFLERFDSKYDPGGVFARIKGDNLTFVQPLVELLRSCKNLTVQTFGSEDAAQGVGQVDVLFVDLILSNEISGRGEVDTEKGNEAVGRSLDRAGKLYQTNKPSVVLMSSHAERGKRESEAYRKKLADEVYASRFTFVDKNKVQGKTANDMEVEAEAAEALLDIFQSYTFGRGLSEALDQWLNSAAVAATDLGAEIRQLQLKEIAYLVKFRLASEGQDLQEYLEWFFGECLLDQVNKTSDLAKSGKHVGNLLEPATVKAIDGYFEPTRNIALMFHKARIEPPRVPARKNFRLGDLYLRLKDGKSQGILAVMNPDCDLMLRPNGRRSAKTLLTISGDLHSIDELSNSMGDLIIVDDAPFNIEWDYHDVRTFAFEESFATANLSSTDYRYIGCLRPMYAQEIQAHMLTHLGRVGVAVPPVIGIPATATVVMFKKGGQATKVPIPHDAKTNCSVLPARATREGGRVVFDRHFAMSLVSVMKGLDPESLELSDDGLDTLKALQKDTKGALLKALFSGAELEKSMSFGLLPTSKEPKPGKGGAWCCLHVESVRSDVAIVGADNIDTAAPTVPAVTVAAPAVTVAAPAVTDAVPEQERSAAARPPSWLDKLVGKIKGK